MPEKPNIILIITDQQSAGMMSCAGNRYVDTPGMDWLASEGIRFENAYCTNPVCVPSRFSLLTGRYPSAIGQRSNSSEGIDHDGAQMFYRQGMGWLLQQAGYEAVYAGKQHLPCGTAEDAGFRVIGLDERGRLAKTCAAYVSGKHYKPFALVASFINPHDICYMAIRDGYNSGDSSPFAKMIIDRGQVEISCLDKASELPEGVSREEFFSSVCPELPDNHLPQEDEPEGIDQLMQERLFRRKARDSYTDEQWRMHRWAYANLTSLVDREISLLLEAVKRNGLDENTVIVFTSDHGDLDSSHKLEHKTVHYREATNVPMIIRPAGGLKNPVVDAAHLVCNGLDILPTVCDYAGIGVPEGIDGSSLRSIVDGTGGGEWRESLLIEGQNSFSVTDTEWQYTLYDSGENREQLYDLKNDPGQTKNHIKIAGNKGILLKFRNDLAKRIPLVKADGGNNT